MWCIDICIIQKGAIYHVNAVNANDPYVINLNLQG